MFFTLKLLMINTETIEYQNAWTELQNKWDKDHLKLYHISSMANREKILSEGLIPHSMNGPVIFYSNRIFLLTSTERVFEIQELIGKHTSFMDIWEIDNSDLKLDLHLDDIAKDKRCCYVSNNIPSSKLKLIKTIEPLII